MKQFNIKTLATSLSLAMTATLATQAQASDIEIYTVPDQAQKTIVMMLDTSGSMAYCDVSITLPLTIVQNNRFVQASVTYPNYYSVNYWVTYWDVNELLSNGTRRYLNRDTINSYIGSEKSTTTPQYNRKFCYGQNASHQRTNVKYYDRMTKLKDAVFALMDSNDLDDTVHVSVGQFTDSSKGTIRIPSAPLTAEHRQRIKNYIAELEASGSTPTASAYAEAAAYMMGTNTVAETPKVINYRQLWVARDPNNLSSYTYCGRKDAKASKLTDPISELNVDATGACTGIAGSTLTKTFNELKSEGYTGAHQCRGLNGQVWTGYNNVVTYCMFKDGDVVESGVSSTDYNNQYSGFAKSVSDSKKEDQQTYKSPLPATGRECSGQSIYFLTDGEPNNANNPQYLMKAALGSKGDDFPQLASDFLDTSKYLNSEGGEGMAQAGELAKRLRDPERNPQGVSVTTAFVGFGSDFVEAKNVKRSLVDSKGKPRDYYDCSKITKRTIRNACNFGEKSHAELPNVGGYGEGGFYYAEDSKDLIDSFLAVANNIEVKFNPITTGSPTIPVNSLNRQSFLDDAYYASFVPLPDKAQQLWTGNMNKYKTVNGTLRGQDEQALFQTNGLINTTTLGLWDRVVGQDTASGVLGNLKLRTNEQNETQRQVYTETQGTTARTLTRVTVDSLRNGSFSNSDAKNHWLSLLGYAVSENETVDFNQLSKREELRQLGATMHSSPLLLTQSGKISVVDGRLKDSNRDDYIVYGSTQGLLHIVDADTGEEKFAFVPQKMVEKQKQAFLHEGTTMGGRDNLFYGVDGAWVAHTEYVPRTDGTLTVGSSNPNIPNASKGKQWIYGGLRMGGKNYYGLDLSDIANNTKKFDVQGQLTESGQVTGTPVLKFNIDPDDRAVYNQTGRKTYSELAHMGQSWSKPSLGYVKWNGTRRLVMFVGGGYDAGYEASDYDQTNGVGAGVYMFDAETGELLWWASNNSASTPTNGVAKHSATDDDNGSLRYSVVSRINTLDRDSDGLIDALYFGDLAGQGFRIDLNNDNKPASGDTPAVPFSIRVVRIFNEHKADGTSPRFYEMPSISVHEAQDGSRFMVAAFGSGDRSSPLAGERIDVFGNPVTKNANTADDIAVVAYDYDVGNINWRTLAMSSLKTRATEANALKPAVLNENDKANEVVADGVNQGWKYTFISPDDKKGRYKTFGEPFAIADLLFVNTYDRDGGGLSGECGGGVIGVSNAYQFCLPTGICKQDKHGYTRDLDVPVKSNATPGLVEITLGNNGQGSIGSSNVGNISTAKDSTTNGNTAVDCNVAENQSRIECLNIAMPSTLTQLRWFEARKEGN